MPSPGAATPPRAHAIRCAVSRRDVVKAMGVGVLSAACGADEMREVPRIGTSTGKVIYATWGPPGVRDGEHWTLLSFEKNYTDLKVDVVLAADSERAYVARLKAMLASGSEPDVMRLPGANAVEFHAGGATTKLDALVRRDRFRPDGLAGPFDAATWRKSWHGFPRGRTAAWGWFFNRAWFDRAEVPVPGPSWTWGDLLESARRLVDPAADRWGLSIAPLAAFPLPWLWGAGGDDLDRAGATSLWDAPAAREALEWIHALRHVHRVAPPPGMHEHVDAFAGGRVAMWFGCADDEFALKRAGAPDFGFAPQPRGRSGQSAAWAPDIVSIASRAPSPDDAWEFLQFVVDADAQRLELEHGLWLPQARAITNEATYRQPAQAPHDRRAGIAGATAKVRSPVMTPTSGAMREAATAALAAYWRGDMAIEQAVSGAIEASRRAIGGDARGLRLAEE